MCWQLRVLAIDGKSVESGQILGISVRTAQQDETMGGKEPWEAASRASCAEAGPAVSLGAWSRPCSTPNGGGEGCCQLHMGSNSSSHSFSRYLLSCYKPVTILGTGGTAVKKSLSSRN